MKGLRIIVPKEREISFEEFELEEEKLREDEALVKNIYTMISPGTELSIYTGIDPEVYVPTSWCHYPFKPGYIGVGRVIKVGKKVENLKEGDLIYYFSNHASHSIIKAGNTLDRSFFVKAPYDMDLKLIPITKFGTIALTSLRVSSLDSGDSVLIVGLGLVGNLASQLFKIAGAKVIGVDLSKRRLDLAKKAGIDILINPQEKNLREEVLRLTQGKGVEIAVDAVGDSKIVIEIADLVKDMGEIILLGTPRKSYIADITPLLRIVHLRWVTIKGALEWCFPLYESVGSKFSYEKNSLYILELIKDKKLIVEDLITHVIKPEDFKSAYEGLLNRKDEYIGVLIDWRD
ncbi:MAG: zinc-binding dehydrogenase [Dictyoglomaceae bacterium]|nr:zinc-binding dehydrogenase [Dictyoglomaceae bacterium]